MNSPWVHSLWVRCPEACFGLVGVAASVSEWTKNHSLTLAATPIEKRGADTMGGLVEYHGVCSGVGAALRRDGWAESRRKAAPAIANAAVRTITLRRGFTLLEVVLAIGVFAIGLVAVMALFAPVVKSTGESADLEAAARVGEALAWKLKSEPLAVVAERLKNSTAGGHQLLSEDGDPDAHPGRSDRQILFASRDGFKIGSYDDPVWREAEAGVSSDREKFFEIALIRNEALSPVGSEGDLESPYLAYTARVRWPAFVPDRGSGAIEIGVNPARVLKYDHSQQRVMFFAGAVAR